MQDPTITATLMLANAPILMSIAKPILLVATFVVVLALSYATFAIIKAVMGLRVPESEEIAGLDISSHGMYGYPEAFIPQEEYPVGNQTPMMAGTPVATPDEQ